MSVSEEREAAEATEATEAPVTLFVNTPRLPDPYHLYTAAHREEEWEAKLQDALEMVKTFDEQICASTPEPALDPTDDWMVQRKATFRDNLAQGKVRWETLKLHWNGPGVQATTRNVVWMDADEALAAIRSGEVSRLSALTNVYWR